MKQYEKINKLYKTIKSQAEIARILNISRQRVHQVVNNYKTVGSTRTPIMIRDNNACRLCYKKRNIMIHHLDKNTNNNISLNLITVCQKCHSLIHQNIITDNMIQIMLKICSHCKKHC